MEPRELNRDERAELDRLRARVAAYEAGDSTGPGRWARRARWLGACAILIVVAVLSTLSVVAVYLRAEVLDTETYVTTVAPLSQDLAVREAVANRLADEIVTRTDIAGLATQLAERLVEQGAPERIGELVGPAVSGLRSLLFNEIFKLLGTTQFQTLWEQVNRTAHTELVTVLTGRQSQFVTSAGTTVTIDLGALLSAAKQELAARGLGIVSRIPDVSIPYELVDSRELPTVRRYTRLLNGAATWLPFVTLGLLITGVLVAPNRRRGIITGFVVIGVASAAALGALALVRTYYLDNLPTTIRSPDAAAIIIDTMLRFLVASLQTLLFVTVIFVVAALLAGPGRPAVILRRLVNRGLDAAGRGLTHAGSWVSTTGRALLGARWAIQAGLVLAALTGLIFAERPGLSAVFWTTLVVLALLVIVEVFIRAAGQQPR